MIPTYTEPYRDGELRIGWASWDHGEYKARSIKYAYPDSSGKISRGSPELPFDILIDMLLLAGQQNELRPHLSPVRGQPAAPSSMSKQELIEERKQLNVVLMRLQGVMMDAPWANWEPIYDEVGARREKLDAELSARTDA